ncbi:MAG: contact-dependent growth inhibition system immunity protein [Bacteroidota bacterium]|nr:contact-dependent growth inhibition system immunity protein [Bacteroidota bacterium]
MEFDRNKTLEQLEESYSEKTNFNSYLVNNISALRKKPLAEFGIEDLRIMINQGIGLNYLIPIAVERLQENLFAEGDYYPGDLLNTVLKVKEDYWKKNRNLWVEVKQLYNKNYPEIENDNLYKQIRINFQEFERITAN